MQLTNRSHQKEWLDLGPSFYTASEYARCMRELDKVGRYLGGDSATWWAFNQLKAPPQSIVDVGCGGGAFTMRLAERYPNAQVKGIDISPEAIEYAKQQQKGSACSNIEFSVSNLDYPSNSIDVVTATLVCHHLSDSELVHFIQEAYRIAKHEVILNDLQRCPQATIGYALVAPFLFRSRMVIHDGLISIRRGFTKNDWIALLNAAKIPSYSLTQRWACRWIVRMVKHERD